jgi:hypothetical protein
MTSAGFGINNISSAGTLNLNFCGDTLLSKSLNISGITKLYYNVKIISSCNISGFTTLSNNTTIISQVNVS